MKKFRLIGTKVDGQELDNEDCDIETVLQDFLNQSDICDVLIISRVK